MSIVDKITGRAKQAAGDIAGDASLKRQGDREERKGDVKEERDEALDQAERADREAADLERRT